MNKKILQSITLGHAPGSRRMGMRKTRGGGRMAPRRRTRRGRSR